MKKVKQRLKNRPGLDHPAHWSFWPNPGMDIVQDTTLTYASVKLYMLVSPQGNIHIETQGCVRMGGTETQRTRPLRDFFTGI